MQVHGVRAFDVALDLINQEIIHTKANSKIKKKISMNDVKYIL